MADRIEVGAVKHIHRFIFHFVLQSCLDDFDSNNVASNAISTLL